MECCVIHDGRATLTPSLSRNIWLAVLIMANIDAAVDAADTQKNDTPTAQHVCYGVHGGAIKHPKGAAAFELQDGGEQGPQVPLRCEAAHGQPTTGR